MIFTARQLQEKSRNRTWTSKWPLSTLPKHFTQLVVMTYGKVWLFYQIYNNGAAFPRWYACKGPKWWRVFWSIPCDTWSQARFSTSFNSIWHDLFCHAFQDDETGIPIRYRFDGKLFNLRKLQAKSKVQTKVLYGFLFADDMTKGAPTDDAKMFDSYNFTISIKKTEMVY